MASAAAETASSSDAPQEISALDLIATRVAQPPKYVLTTGRSFPSLEPQTLIPVSSTILGETIRRDILWRAVVFEADASRVGSSNTKSRSEMGYSRQKLRPQKGSGRARMGDRGSPTRHDGGRAFARHAPFDWSTGLPRQIYAKAVRVALSHLYKSGRLFVLDDGVTADFVTSHTKAGDLFVKAHNIGKHSNLLVIPSEFRMNFHEATENYHKIEIVSKDAIEVRDLLKAENVIIEKEALEYLAEQYRPEDPIATIA